MDKFKNEKQEKEMKEATFKPKLETDSSDTYARNKMKSLMSNQQQTMTS